MNKSLRVAALARAIASAIGADPVRAERAAALAKCDLLSHMVGEFPELQGVMGRYCAQHDGEDAEVALAIDEHYLPRYAGDNLPNTHTGQALALADKLDTLAGIFAIGMKPTGDKDPYGFTPSRARCRAHSYRTPAGAGSGRPAATGRGRHSGKSRSGRHRRGGLRLHDGAPARLLSGQRRVRR